METLELKELKEIMESILPKDIVDKTRLVGEYLSSAVEIHVGLQSKVILVSEKITKVKKELENDIQELLNQKSVLIKENVDFFNDRSEKARLFDSQILKKEFDIGSLTKTFEDYSEKINSISKNIVGLMFEKDVLTKDIESLSAATSSMRTNHIDIENQFKISLSKKEEAFLALDVVLQQIEDAKIKLQSINNEIIIKSNR